MRMMETYMKSDLFSTFSERQVFGRLRRLTLAVLFFCLANTVFCQASDLGVLEFLGQFLEQNDEKESSAKPDTPPLDNAGLLQGLLGMFSTGDQVAISDVTIRKIADQTYTGKECRPVPKLTYKGNTLKRGTDYSVSYRDNIKAGTGKCVITGKGDYKGQKTVSFNIVKEKKTSSASGTGKAASGKGSSGKSTATGGKFTVKVSASSVEYTGSARKPSVKVTAKGKSVPASQYTVTYSGNTKVGTATVKVTGKGDYKGYSGSATFKITLKAVTVSGIKSPKAGTVQVTWREDSQADGYQIEYCTNKAFSQNVKKKQITSSKTVTAELTDLKSGKNAYVRIRAYQKGNSRNTYGPWSNVRSVQVK